MKALSLAMLTVVDKKSRQRPTISDVARLAGVSISTVSRVVNETAPVSEDVEQRVRSAIDMLSYTPHAAARSLAVRRTNTIGLLLPELSSAFFTPLLRGVESAVRRTNYDLLIYANPRSSAEAEARRRPPIGEHNADGMMVFSTTLDDRDLIRNYEHGFPMVLMHRRPPNGISLPGVTFDNRGGTMRLIEHLVVAHGRQRIVFLHGPEGNEDSLDRELAYRAVLTSHGILFDAALVARGSFSEPGGRAAIEEMLRRGVAFDAVFAGDDEAAVGVYSALRDAGIRVPEDVAVVGFDDIQFARHLNPSLTTMRAPIEQAGYLAAQQLFRLLRTGESDPVVTLPVEIVIRQSCGCP